MPEFRARPFLRIPPFPGARARGFSYVAGKAPPLSDDQVDKLIAEIRNQRVGGDYWAQQPDLPSQPYVLVKTADKAIDQRIASGAPVLRWSETPCDPWHMFSGASHVIVDADDEHALLAAIACIPLTCVGEGRFCALGLQNAGQRASVRDLFRATFAGHHYSDPFSDMTLPVAEVIRLCGFWRRLIDSNREILAAVGFGFWKRPTVAPLLWGGSDVLFASDVQEDSSRSVAVWKSKTDSAVLERLTRTDQRLVEVEDGFIRSAGLGADCVPPLSIVVDPVGIYFDPARPSLLEQLIQSGPFTPEILKRARQLRELIIASGVSKYGVGSSETLGRRAERLHILVPGQVEDDRSVQCGGGDLKSNLELLRRVRRCAPNAHIIYKPHPDVEAGHRVGAIPDEDCLRLADEVVRDEPITALIELADEVHVNTSLAGFEALLRLKPVTTHGVPFYAGWGLTRDLGEVPARRTAKPGLEELVAAALLLYPRYLDPVTGLPCPPEVLVQRLAQLKKQPSVVVQLRRLQGRLKKYATLARGAH